MDGIVSRSRTSKQAASSNQIFAGNIHSSEPLQKATDSENQPLESRQGQLSRPKSLWHSALHSIQVFRRFTRPYSTIGTILGIVSVSLLAAEGLSDISLQFFEGLFLTIAAAICMHVYGVGINQLTDIEIDKVNKPNLPLASGEYSYRTGVLIVAASAISGFFLAWIVGSWPLFWGLFVTFVLGTTYSVDFPMLRWKRSGMLAAMSIFIYRALIIQTAYYLHMQTHVFQRPAAFPRHVIFATAFMSVFSVVIALVKDVPDIEGDRKHNIDSFAVRLGAHRVFWICVSLLEMAYVAAMLVGAMSSSHWSKLVAVLTHILAAWILLRRAKSTNPKSNAAAQAFYMFIWKLVYVEYMLFPLMK